MIRIALTAVLVASLSFALGAGPADPRAVVAQGTLVGTMDNGVSVFRGVPFAAPPVGDLRWAPPRPPATYGSAPRPATAFGAPASGRVVISFTNVDVKG